MADDNRRDDDRFLARWSRRKGVDRELSQTRRGGAAPVATARATTGNDTIPTVGDKTGTPPAVAPDAKPETVDEAKQEAALRDLPSVDALNKDSDFAPFLKDGVPDALKQQALRRLWALDPQFDVVDPFTEYGGDYTVVIPIDALKDTIHKTDLGYLTPEELAEQRGEAKKKPPADGKDADAPAGGDLAEAGDAGAAPGEARAGGGDESAGRPASADNDDQAATDEPAVAAGPEPRKH